MIVTTPEAFREEIQHMTGMPTSLRLPKALFMVEPQGFFISEQTARDNVYMNTDAVPDNDQALKQHAGLANTIADCGLSVIRFPGNPETPDDVFPNNVFGTSPGRFIVGSMLHPERQREADRTDIRAFFTQTLDYTEHDISNQADSIAELTGATIIDRSRKIGFCGLTQRANAAGCKAMHEAFDLELTYQFELKPDEYHTNVVMTVLADRAVILYPDAFVDPRAAAAIAECYPGRALFIDQNEKNAFAGNCIAINDQDVIISQTATRVLSEQKITMLTDWGFTLHSVPFNELEYAGGSVRCAIGEVF